MEQEITSTKRFFESHHIALSDEWLESCIEWYREQNPNSTYSKEILHLKVYEQWLLLDLRDAEVAILPPNLSQQQKIVLNGIYSLQMMQVVDISQPKLSQLHKIRNMVLNATDEEYSTTSSSKRMLQLLLTDGVQEVEAIEYRPIPVLDVNLTPGIKLKISGPVTVRRGQLMLESQNIEILGGEVEELLISNAAENILAKDLNMPLNPHPNIKHEEQIASDVNMPQAASNSNNASVGNQYICFNIPQRQPGSQQSAMHQSTITSYITNSSSNYESSIKTKQPNQNANISSCSNPNITVKNNIPTVAATNYTGGTFKQSTSIADEEQMIIDECDNLLEIQRDLEMEQSKKTSDINKSRFADEADVDVFASIDIDSHLDLIDRQVAGPKITSISDLYFTDRKNGKFIIKAKFKSVSGKLNIGSNQQWNLRIIVEDETGEIESWVHSDVIADIVSCTPSTMLTLKESFRNKNQEAGELIIQKVKELRSKIEQLDCIMELTFAPTEEHPTITRLS